MNMRWRTQARCHHTTPPAIDDLLLQARSGLARLEPALALSRRTGWPAIAGPSCWA